MGTLRARRSVLQHLLTRALVLLPTLRVLCRCGDAMELALPADSCDVAFRCVDLLRQRHSRSWLVAVPAARHLPGRL